MKSSALVSIIVAITIAPWGSSYAQGYGDRDNHFQRGDQREQRDDRMRQQNRRDGWRGDNNDARSEMRGVGPNHEFHRGQRFPAEYRHQQYVVDNWREHNLSAPPRGYHWVQSGSDYVLVAIASGVILQLLLDH